MARRPKDFREVIGNVISVAEEHRVQAGVVIVPEGDGFEVYWWGHLCFVKGLLADAAARFDEGEDDKEEDNDGGTTVGAESG